MDANVPVISANGMAFNISNTLGRSGGRLLMDPYSERPTGRGSLEDNDEPLGRKAVEAEALEKQQPWEAKKLNEEQMRNNLIRDSRSSCAPTSSCASLTPRRCCSTAFSTKAAPSPNMPSSSTHTSARAACCSSATTPSIAAKPSARMGWSSTPSSTTTTSSTKPRRRKNTDRPFSRRFRTRGLFPRRHFVSCCHPWETKTEARKKPRRRLNPNRNPNQPAGVKFSPRLRPNKANAHHLFAALAVFARESPPVSGGLSCDCGTSSSS